MSKAICVLVVVSLLAGPLRAETLTVGPGQSFGDPAQAAAAAGPGDTILIFPGTYDRTSFIEELHGAPGQWVVFRGTGRLETVLGGGTESLHFINCSYILIENLVIERNTGNGINIDDGGDYATPARHFIIRDCVFRDMGAQGNNDFLKLSGLDSFEVSGCLFEDGAAGGSGIDMVGCHWGLITGNEFESLGSNSIQAKGGTRYITISRNFFLNGGLRAMNLGGSTGLPFFRPIGVDYEARDLYVFANVVLRSDAPVAYVGSQDVRVWNNTFIYPGRWAVRILQESADTSFFRPASRGEFVNNIILVGDELRTAVNIGPNTRPASFTFSHNMWFHPDDPAFSPVLPVVDTAMITGEDPQLEGVPIRYLPSAGSRTIGSGTAIPTAFDGLDHYGYPFAAPPSRGAVEGTRVSGSGTFADSFEWELYPNPSRDQIQIRGHKEGDLVRVLTTDGKLVREFRPDDGRLIPDLPPGLYVVQCVRGAGRTSRLVVIQ